MDYTFLDFQGIVRRNVKFNANNAELVQLCKDSINIGVYQVARQKMWSELLVPRTSISLAGYSASGGVLNLPVRFMMLERARFKDITTGKQWRLVKRTDLVPPAPVSGKPQVYELFQGTGGANPTGIALEPFATVANTDLLYVDYYVAPPLLAADEDKPLSTLWDDEIIKRAEHYMLTYLNKIPQALQMFSSMLGQAQQPDLYKQAAAQEQTQS